MSRCVSALFSTVLIGGSYVALGAVTGTVSGTIVDQTGGAVPGSKITITNVAQGFKNNATTDSKGEYTFPSLPVGRYDLHVEARGFHAVTRSSIAVDLDAVLKIDFVL